MATHLAAPLVFLGALASASAQQTWTVAGGGGAQFTEIAAAVAAAADGDIILVGPGNYAPFVIDGKGLVILNTAAGLGLVGGFVSNPGFTPSTAPPPVTVKNLMPNQRVVVHGMQIFNLGSPPADVLLLDCLGQVWLETLFCDSYGASALRSERCAEVVLVDCFLQTNHGTALPSGAPIGTPGAHLRDSRVFAYDCQFRGSHGVLQLQGFPTPNAAADGGSGLDIIDSVVVIQGGEIDGGGGNSHSVGGCTFGGNGGHGVVLTTAGGQAPELWLRDVVPTPGFPGPFHCGPTPVAGLPSRVLAGQIVTLAGDNRSLRCLRHFAAATAASLEVVGNPGDAAFFFTAAAAPALPVLGVLVHLTVPVIPLGLAFADAAGRATLSLALPGLPSGAPTFSGVLQAAVLASNGDLFATGPASIVVLR